MSNVKTNAKILLSLLIIVLAMISFGTISTHAASLPSKGHVYTGTATAEKEQTVTVKTPTPPITGDTKKMLPWIILAVVIAGGIGTVVYKKKTMKK